MQDQKLSGALQENILTLLVFSDEYSSIIRNSITPNLFESAVFRDIASQAIDFIDQFGTSIKEHLPDSLEHILEGSDKRKATSYSRVMDNLYLAKDSINGKYVINQLNGFIRQQNIKNAIVKAVASIENGEIDQAEVDLQYGLNKQIVTFTPGISLGDASQSLKFFDSATEGIQLGIKTLDDRGITPAPGEMFLVIAPAKKGKSWALVHIGKMALLQRKKVLVITLEMSEYKYAQRFIQSFFAIGKREANVKTPQFVTDSLGRLVDIEIETIVRPTLNDPGIRAELASRLTREFKYRPPLMIKQFPTGSLTIPALKAYLDGLERFHKFVPDVLIIDYPDLMEMDSKNLRIDTGRIYKDLRGIAVSRNLALVAASQGNREAATSKLVTGEMASEDYSKIATADNVITYSQTLQEKALGLARIFVSQGRNDEDKFVSLITQSYATGQFCLDSTLMLSDYWDFVENLSAPRSRRGKRDDDEEQEE
jgi:replicative DNA helicase